MIYSEDMVFRRLTVMKWILAWHREIICEASLGPQKTAGGQRRYKQWEDDGSELHDIKQ